MGMVVASLFVELETVEKLCDLFCCEVGELFEHVSVDD